MRVNISPHPHKKGYFRVTPHGSIDTDTHDIFRKLVKPLLNPSTKGILIDLRDVDYISSAGIGVIFSLKTFFKENDGQVLFCNLKPQIQKVFDVMKMVSKKSVFKSLEEADQFLYRMMDEEIRKQSGDSKER